MNTAPALLHTYPTLSKTQRTQRLVYDLLRDSHIAEAITRGVRYVMVDEYQDTNFIQEQLLLKLSAATGNLCVVGDEDQSLYRFRGATVRNILEFTARVPDCTVVKLTTNYRSHTRIVQAYDRWMASADWSNPRGLPFRYDKTIQPDLNTEHPDYPAVFCIWGRDEQDEAQRFADMVAFLKEHDVIADYSQVALLLHSVRQEHSGPYLAALEAKGIPAFCAILSQLLNTFQNYYHSTVVTYRNHLSLRFHLFNSFVRASCTSILSPKDREDLVEDARDRLIQWLALRQQEGETDAQS